MSEQDSFERIVSGFEPQPLDDRVPIDEPALDNALHYIRIEKELAIERADREAEARWRDEEKQMLLAKVVRGVRKIVEP
jgi:hypothetical protein